MIESYSFGKIVIDGVEYTKDLKIIKGKVVPDWWRKSGHRVEIGDVQDILKERPGIVVLGKGKPGLMNPAESLKNLFKENRIELIVESTSKAIQTYNRLYKEGRDVAAGFHLTC